MRIAVNTRFLLSDKMEGFGWYTFEIVRRLVTQHPEHEFIFFFDRPYDPRFIFGQNVTPVILRPQARHPLLFRFWFEVAVKRALEKHRADVFFSPDGYLSLGSTVKQVGVIHDINFEHNPLDIPKRARNYLRAYFPKFAQKADHIITVSDYSKQDISATYSISKKKITAIWNGASDAFRPLSETDKKKVEETYTQGAPYLLFVGAIHPRKNIKRLIQAFIWMKENDPTNSYKLVIAGSALFSSMQFDLGISEKWKSEILFTGHLPLSDLARLMGGATIFTFVPYFEGFGIPLVEAMKTGTPILSGSETSLPEVAGDAALYCDPFDTTDITEKMTQLCNDPVLRTTLSEKGLKRAQLFSWDQSAEQVWEVLEKVYQQK